MISLSELCIIKIIDLLYNDHSLTLSLPKEVATQILTISYHLGKINKSLLSKILQEEFISLSLPSLNSINDSVLITIVDHCPNLMELNLSRCQALNDESVQIILANFHNLKRLSVEECFQITHKGFKGGHDLLTTLNVSNTSISNELFLYLQDLFPNIYSLYLSETNIDSNSFSLFISNFNNSSYIKSIHLAECKSIDSESIISISEFCPSIESLNISGCYKVKDYAFVKLIQKCKKIKELSISRCNQLLDSSFTAISQMESLESLDITWCMIKNESFELLSSTPSFVHNLRYLNASWCTLVDEDIFNQAIKRFDQLVDLDLSWKTISDDCIGEILRNCKNLSSLNLTGTNISSEGFKHFIHRSYPNLMRLNLSWAKGLSDENLIGIIKACNNLLSLDISLCSNITNKSIVHIPSSLKKLKHLMMSRCRQFNDDGFNFTNDGELKYINFSEVEISDYKLNEMFRYNNDISMIVLSGCRHLTEFTIDGMVNYLKSIKILNLNGCRLIQDDGIIMLVNQFYHSIQKLSLSETNITEKSIKLISKKCLNLNQLNISYCSGINDKALGYISKYATSIISLDLATCNVSCDSVIEVVISLPILRHLNVSGCKKIDNTLIHTIHHIDNYITSLDVSLCHLISPYEIKSLQENKSKNMKIIQ